MADGFSRERARNRCYGTPFRGSQRAVGWHSHKRHERVERRWPMASHANARGTGVMGHRFVEAKRPLAGIPINVTSESSADGRWLLTRTREEQVLWDTVSWKPKGRWLAFP